MKTNIVVAVASAALVGSAVRPGSAASASTTTPAGSWLNEQVRDARTGETFSVSSLTGKQVYVENFATWCGECRHQLGNVERAAATAPANTVFVAFSVETDLPAAKVAAYAKAQGFSHIKFAVMTPKMLLAVKRQLGIAAITPPSTPHVFITTTGAAGKLRTGYEVPAKILSDLHAAA